MGQVCSCAQHDDPKDQGEVVSKVVAAPPKPQAQQNGSAARMELPPTPPPKRLAVENVRTLVQQVVHASRGDVAAALDSDPEDDGEDWQDPLGELHLEEVLDKWEEDQATTLERLDRALQLLQSKGLGELAAPSRKASMRAEEPLAQQQQQQQAGAGAAAAAVAAAPPSFVPRTSLERIRHGLDAILSAMYAPHGSQQEQMVRELHEARDERRVLTTERLLQELCSELNCSMEQLQEHEEMLGVDVRKVQHEARLVRSVLEDIENDEGWMLSRDGSLRVLYKHEKGGTGHSLKFRAILTHPVDHVMAMANEFDLVKTWNKFVMDSLKVWQEDIFECIVYGSQWMPRPFKHFYSLVKASGYDLSDEDRSLLVLIEDASIGSLPPGAEPLPAATPKRRVCNVRQGSCIKMRPLPAKAGGLPTTEVFLMVHIDPHIPMLPAFILNFVLGVLAPYIYQQANEVLTKCFSDPDGVYPTRIREQPELYGRIRRRLAQYAAELGYGYAQGEQGPGQGGSLSARSTASGGGSSAGGGGRIALPLGRLSPPGVPLAAGVSSRRGSEAISAAPSRSGLPAAAPAAAAAVAGDDDDDEFQPAVPTLPPALLDTFDRADWYDAEEGEEEEEGTSGSDAVVGLRSTSRK